jgi:predicted permease
MTIFSVRDVRHALRRFAREPLFTAVTLLTLGLGIGASTAVYSVVDGVLLEPLPYEEPQQLVTVVHAAPGWDMDRIPNSRSSHVVYQEQTRSFQSMALHSGASVTLTEAGDPARLPARLVTPSLFQVLRVQPALGRPFTEDEGREGGEAVVLLSHGLWVERYGADPDMVGRTIPLEGESHRVVGVMPRGFAFPDERVRLWLPMHVDPAATAFRGFNEEGIGRLAPDVTPEAARRELQSLIPRLSERYADFTPALLEQTGLQVRVHPYMDDVVGEVRTALWVLLGTVGLVLLIACANVANLMLVRAEARRREVALRSAMGAGQGELLGQHLTESLTLTAAGAALGLVLAWLGLDLLRTLGGDTLPRLDQVGLDGSVLLFTVGVTTLAAAAFALVPVLRHRSLRPGEELRDGSRFSTGGRQGIRARELLVAGQVALALVLLVGSGLMVRSFSAIRNVDPGFQARGVLTFRISLPQNSYGEHEEVASFHRSFLEQIRALPGVEGAGAVSHLPVAGMSGINGFYPRSDPPPADELAPVLETRAATPGYFEAMGIPVVQGRGPRWTDGTDGSAVVFLSGKAAETLLGQGSSERDLRALEKALGREIVRAVSASEGAPSARVVGVVGDVHNVSLVEEPMGAVYYSPTQGEGQSQTWLTRSMSYAVRTSGDPLGLVPGLRRLLREADPRLPLSSVRSMDDRMTEARARTVFTLTMLVIAALMGLILGAVGLYGVVSHVTARRTREIGLRMALGAEGRKVRGMVLRRGMLVSGGGALVGWGGAWAVSRSLDSLLYGVEPTDPLTYGAVTGLLLTVTFVATWLPAYRASSVDVVEALRSE